MTRKSLKLSSKLLSPIPPDTRKVIVKGLRRAWGFTDPTRKAFKNRHTIRKKNPSTGYMKNYWECEQCKRLTPEIKVDHIIPIGKEPQTWIELCAYIYRLFCRVQNLQLLCEHCHNLKTAQERAQARTL